MDTKACNEQNFDKSRAVCEGIEREDGGGHVVLTDREREILDMWPKFEDGEYVWFGDETDRIVGKVIAIQFGAALVSFWNDSDDRVYMDYGERLKRPAPKVLDADGVEIKFGDTVWCGNGVEMTVMSLVGELPGHVTTHSKIPPAMHSIDPKLLTHTRPDSWERLEEDAESIRQTIAYNFGDFSPSDFKRSGDSLQDRVSDIVRRAKALAGVEE